MIISKCMLLYSRSGCVVGYNAKSSILLSLLLPSSTALCLQHTRTSNETSLQPTSPFQGSKIVQSTVTLLASYPSIYASHMTKPSRYSDHGSLHVPPCPCRRANDDGILEGFIISEYNMYGHSILESIALYKNLRTRIID